MRLEADGPSARISCPTGMRPSPGQYLAACSPDANAPLPLALFPSRIEKDSLLIAPPLPYAWSVGMKLKLRGPLGKGFHLPTGARRVAVASLEESPARLLPLVAQALDQGAAVALYAQSTLADLAEEVEVLPLDLLPEAPGWADYLALEVSPAHLAGLRSHLKLAPHQRLDCYAQVLILSPMPCTGLADCGVCAVETRQGWSLSCVDGPVYDFSQIEGV